MRITLPGLALLKSLKNVTRFGWPFTPRGGAEEVAAISNTLPNIQQPEIGRADFPAEDIAKLAYFRDLALLWLAGSSTSDEAVRGLLRLPKLAEVDLKIHNRITDIGLVALAGHKTLKEIVCSKALGVTD